MPYLEMTPELLEPEPTKVALAYVEALMLWPDDPKKRERALYAAAAIELGRTARRIEESGKNAVIDSSHVNLLLHASPPEEIRASAVVPFRRGAITAEIFCRTLHDERVGLRRGLQAAKNEARVQYEKQQDFEHLSGGTIEKIWAVYQPVAHLWGAWKFMVSANYPFPCRLADLPDFLAKAEALRLDGEACHLRQSKKPLLNPQTTWVLPDRLRIPHVKVVWHTRGAQFECSTGR